MNHSKWLDPGMLRLRPALPRPLSSAVNPYAFSSFYAFISFHQSSMRFVRPAEGWVCAESWPRKVTWTTNGREWDFPVGDETRLRGGKATEAAARGACQFPAWFAVLLRLVLCRLACPRGVCPSKGLLPLQVWGLNQLHSHHPWFPEIVRLESRCPQQLLSSFFFPPPTWFNFNPVDSEISGDRVNPKSEARALPILSPRGLLFLPQGIHTDPPWLTNKQQPSEMPTYFASSIPDLKTPERQNSELQFPYGEIVAIV